jgi:hypothetical protein
VRSLGPERDHGIHATRAPRRNPYSEQRDGRQEKWDGREDGRIQTTVKIAVLVPMPRVSAATVAMVKPGLRRNIRSEWVSG